MEVSFALKTAIELAQNGNKSSFEFVYKETFSFAWYRANVIMNYNQEAAADLVQEAYVICYQQITRLENTEAFYSWLSAIIYNLGMQYFRKYKREFLVNDSEFEWDALYPPIEYQNNPELSAEEEVTKEIVKDLIEQLPETQKITLLAHYFDGLKIEQIAKIMDCPESTVKSRLNYARTSLKASIEKMEAKYGYRIHVLSYPIMYYALKHLILKAPTGDEWQSVIYRDILTDINSCSISNKEQLHENEYSLDKNLNNPNYTASISAALDASRYATASLGISAVLTASLTGVLDLEPLEPINVLKIDFASLITSIKTKFALASAATAIGNNEITLLQEFNIPPTPTYTMEATLSGYLCDYYDSYGSAILALKDLQNTNIISRN